MLLFIFFIIYSTDFTPTCFSTRRLSDSKSPGFSGTRPSILADLNYAAVWIIFTCPLLFKSSSSFTNHFRIDPSAPNTSGITVIFMFHSFLVL